MSVAAGAENRDDAIDDAEAGVEDEAEPGGQEDRGEGHGAVSLLRIDSRPPSAWKALIRSPLGLTKGFPV